QSIERIVDLGIEFRTKRQQVGMKLVVVEADPVNELAALVAGIAQFHNCIVPQIVLEIRAVILHVAIWMVPRITANASPDVGQKATGTADGGEQTSRIWVAIEILRCDSVTTDAVRPRRGG